VYALVAVAVLPWMLASLTSADAAAQGSGDAARLVQKMRVASSNWSFSGRVALEWHDASNTTQMHTTVVDVTAAYGAVEVVAGSTTVDQYGFTAVIGAHGTPTVLLSPVTRTLPSADHAWTLATRHGPEIAGRPTTVVVATRHDRSAAQRLYIDTETDLFLGRDVLGAHGRVERSLRFMSFHVDGGPRSSTAPSGNATGSSNTRLRRVPDGYRAPADAAGYVLIATTKGDGGGVQLSYSDGIFTVSISERLGDLDWGALAAGGSSTTVAGHTARTYSEPGADVVVWEGDGVVFTCVSDAPMDVTAAMIAGLSPSGRSAVEKAVDFVLGPFSWH
jgi:hypothetical protein